MLTLLFIQIVESLLIEKPANPIAFMIEYLHKQYPDQVWLLRYNPMRVHDLTLCVIQAMLAMPAGKEKGAVIKTSAPSAAEPASTAKAKPADSDEEEDGIHMTCTIYYTLPPKLTRMNVLNVYQDDDVADIPTTAKASGPKPRRTSVSAESMDPTKMK